MSGMFGPEFGAAEVVPPQTIPIMPAVGEPGEYPVDAMCQRLEMATRAIVDKVQVPPVIAAASVLAVAALAVQPFVNICLPTGEVVPCSLFIVTVADSGERKSSVDKLALLGVRQREREMAEKGIATQMSYQVEAAAYRAARKKAESGAKTRIEIKRAIEACGEEPIAPAEPTLICDEPTFEGLTRLFALAMPSLGLFSDEGGQFLGGYSMGEEQRTKTGAGLSKIWDGADIKRTRGGEGVSTLRGRRLSLHLMIQPRIARRFFGDEELRSQGLLSRILVAQPATKKGTRMWREADPQSDVDLERYHGRVMRLLQAEMPMHPETRELSPRVLGLSADARALWIAFHDVVEKDIKPEGAYEDISGFAAKLPEQAARIAAVMAYFQDPEVTEISVKALSAGIKIAQYHVNEALRLIGLGTADQDTENASLLIGWIRKRGHEIVGKRWLGLNAIPKSLRPAPIMKRAIELLVENGHLVEIKNGASMKIGGKEQFYREAYTVIADAPE